MTAKPKPRRRYTPPCARCGTAEGVRVIMTTYPNKVALCRPHVTEFYKGKRKAECAAMLKAYEDIDRCIRRAKAHHLVLGIETHGAFQPPPGGRRTGRTSLRGAAIDAHALLAALAAQSVRYFREFEDQAYRVFPSYRDRQRARGHRVRAAERNAHALPVDVPWLRRMYGDRCVYCGAKSEHIDHLWPLKLGGDDAPWNLAPACSGCNLSKGGKALAEWLPGFLLGRTVEQLDAAREWWEKWSAVEDVP